MRIALEYSLLLTLLISVQSKRAHRSKDEHDVCNLPLGNTFLPLRPRASCIGQYFWTISNNKCMVKKSCFKGYTKKEDCEKNCLHRMATKKPQSKADAHAEAASYAKSWASAFLRLSERQKLYAKRSIDELLVLGRLEKLNISIVTSLTSDL